jgi:hypothetical protein
MSFCSMCCCRTRRGSRSRALAARREPPLVSRRAS